MGYIGICCFTTELPTSDELRHFPNCGNGRGICIEYDTAKLEDFFAKDSKIPIPPIFHDVIYDNEPTKLDTCGDWSILWEKGKDYNKYKTIKNQSPKFVLMSYINFLLAEKNISREQYIFLLS